MSPTMREGTAGVDDAFLELPERVYASDPCWIPEDACAVARAFSSANPWLERGEAATLCAAGAARLAVFHDPTCLIDGERAAFFGYWEQRDASASARLFDEAARWAGERGCTMLYGPVDFTTFGRYRALLAAERGAVPFPGEPYQPASYVDTLGECGFAEARRYVTQLGPAPRAAMALKRPALDACVGAGYSFEPLYEARWMAFVPELYAAADVIFGAGLAYTPVSREYFEAGYGASVARRLCPRTSMVARAPDGAFAGFLLAFPHYGPLAVRGSRLGPVRAADLSFAEHAAVLESAGERTVIVKTVGVMPEHRRRGVLDAMSVLALDRGIAHYDRWMAALVRDGNPSGRFGAPYVEGQRSYALYRRRIGESHG